MCPHALFSQARSHFNFCTLCVDFRNNLTQTNHPYTIDDFTESQYGLQWWIQDGAFGENSPLTCGGASHTSD